MRVQLQGQRLRLRLQEDELAGLLDGRVVENRTALPDGQALVQALSLAASTTWRCDADTWRITLPDADVRAYAQRLPTREGLHYALPAADGVTLQLQFDVDVRDSTRQRMPRRNHPGSR